QQLYRAARSSVPSGIGGKIRTILPEVGFHPEFGAKSGQFRPTRISVRDRGQNPDSSARSGFPSGIRGKIRTVLREVGFPSGIRGKIRTVSKVFHFHPFC